MVMPLFLRADTRRPRMWSIPFLGQKMATFAFGVLVKLVSVVPLALFDAVAMTTTCLVLLLPVEAWVTRWGSTRRVMLPKVSAGLLKSLTIQARGVLVFGVVLSPMSGAILLSVNAL